MASTLHIGLLCLVASGYCHQSQTHPKPESDKAITQEAKVWMDRIETREKGTRFLRGNYTFGHRSKVVVSLRFDFGTGDFGGIFVKAGVGGPERWVQAVSRTATQFIQARPEFHDGAGGSWAVKIFPISEVRAAPTPGSDILPFRLVADMMGLKEMALAVETPHRWFFTRLANSQPWPIDSFRLVEASPGKAVIEFHALDPISKREGTYLYHMRALEGVWVCDRFELAVNTSPGEPISTVGTATFEDYRQSRGFFVPYRCAATRVLMDGKEDPSKVQVRFSSVNLNEPMTTADLTFEPPFASIVEEAGEQSRVGYQNPRSSLGEDPNDTRPPRKP